MSVCLVTCVLRCVCMSAVFSVSVVPLWHLWCSNLLSRGVDMANNKVLGDLLHVLIIEESVEAQLVCRRVREEMKQAKVACGESIYTMGWCSCRTFETMGRKQRAPRGEMFTLNTNQTQRDIGGGHLYNWYYTLKVMAVLQQYNQYLTSMLWCY